MSDPTQATPGTGNTADTTPIDWESPDNPYAQRYRDAQSHLTPLQQENARLKALEEDPGAYLELGKTKGWVEFDEPNGQQEQDPYAERWQRLEQLEQRQAAVDARIEAENAAAGKELFQQDLDKWAEADSVTLTPADHNAILWLTVNSPNPEDEGTARQVYEAHVAQKKADREAIEAEIRESIRRPRVPHVPTNGGTETGVVDYDGMSRAEADRVMAEQVRARTQR